MTMFDLTGRLALITGSSRGIGRAIAEGYVAAGARVLINGRDVAAVDAAVKAIGKNAIPAPFDVTDKAAIEAAVEKIEKDHRADRHPGEQRRHAASARRSSSFRRTAGARSWRPTSTRYSSSRRRWRGA